MDRHDIQRATAWTVSMKKKPMPFWGPINQLKNTRDTSKTYIPSGCLPFTALGEPLSCFLDPRFLGGMGVQGQGLNVLDFRQTGPVHQRTSSRSFPAFVVTSASGVLVVVEGEVMEGDVTEMLFPTSRSLLSLFQTCLLKIFCSTVSLTSLSCDLGTGVGVT